MADPFSGLADFDAQVIHVEVTKRGINQITAKLDPKVLFQHARDGMQDSLNELKTLVVARTPVDTGQAAGNVFTEIEGTTLEDLNGKVFGTDDYFQVLEFGREAGRAMPPSQSIAVWMDRHDIEPKFLFVIRRAISRRGLPAHHMMQKALEEGRQHFAYLWLRRFMDDW